MKYKLFTKSLYLRILIVTLFIFLPGCKPNSDFLSPSIDSTESTETLVQSASNSYVNTTSSYKDLTERASRILMGQVTPTQEIYNAARNPYDITQPHPSMFIFAKVYEVKVERDLKGSGPETFFLFHSEEIIVTRTAEELKESLAAGKRQPYDIHLEADKRYLMFLNEWDPTSSGLDLPAGPYFGGAAQPWLFEVTAEDSVLPQSLWKLAETFFPAQPLPNVLDQIEHPQAYPTPTAPYP